MGKISQKPILLPEKVEVKIEGQLIEVKGPLGTLDYKFPKFVKILKEGHSLKVEVENEEEKKQKAMQGTATRLIENMIKGVTSGFKKKLELIGVGFNAGIKDKNLILILGFSSPINFAIPQGIKITVEKGTVITIEGINKELVGETAARLRHFKSPDPYKGKGIKYEGEEIRKKAMKKVAVTPTA